MVRRIQVFMIGVIGLLYLGACTIPLSQRELLVGNQSFIRGDYQDATVHYLQAQKGGGETQPWVAYNLGNVYHSLGETQIAMELWDSAARTTDPKLLFNVQFNRGIALYESGHYDQAYQAFRASLELSPANMDAKLNLELTQKKMQAAALKSDEGQTPAATESAANTDSARLMEYIRRKEGRLWIPAAPRPETENTNDW